ncbi:hypothetical protein [Paenibacillus camerounensis]|uniref:hypothetical protein n=1 Tax=Paenibacillus camerounensis TaxID=1243663 RepID=UPI0005A8087B|nr:hypothetical protein [Paenibacillus camerounensis]
MEMIDITNMYFVSKIRTDILFLLMQVQDGCSKVEAEESLLKIIQDTAELENNLSQQLFDTKIS